MGTALPPQIELTEVAPRDGFQNVKEWIPTETKIRVIDRLIDAGLKRFEITSFVSPKAIPQMADAPAVAAHVLKRIAAERLSLDVAALVPNLRGATAAREAGLGHVSYVISASAAHNKANINRTHEQSLADLQALIDDCPDLHVTLTMSTVFGCPFDGAVPIGQVLWLAREALALGVDDITFCDTIGVACPAQTAVVVDAIRSAFPSLDFALHLHDTHGMALANLFVAIEHGVTRFETAAGGLGGCPFAPGAAGNAATEDVVNMLHRCGIATGVDLERELAAVAVVRESICSAPTSRLSAARPYFEHVFWAPESDTPRRLAS